MKQEIASTTSENKVNFSPSTTPSRLRSSTKSKESLKPEVVNGGLKPRSRSVLPPDPINHQKVRRSLGLNKLPKYGEETVGTQKGKEVEEVKVVGRTGNRPAEQIVRLRHRVHTSCKINEDDPDGKKKKELQEKLDASENLAKDLQSEIVALKTQLEKLQYLNIELESQNRKFAEDLAAAEMKISTLSRCDQKRESVAENKQSPNFKDVQKLIANKLEHMGAKKDTFKQGSISHMPSAAMFNQVAKDLEMQPKLPPHLAPPPPPPPPLPRVPSRATTAKKAPTLVEFYHTLTKREEKKDALGPGNRSNLVVSNAHSSIVGEIQNRSAHLLAIRSDVETKGEFIKSLIEKIQAAAYADIEDVLNFVDWLDDKLSSLADERAVLKHFNWPEKKADAMREAAIEYRDLKRLEEEVSSHKDESTVPCEAALKKISTLLDKSERSIQRLIKLRDSTMLSYRDCKIPTDWMLDSGMVSKIKQASMKLAKTYMKRVSMELESIRSSEKESIQEALLLQGVRFAYRAHQFAGGLDSETMCAFEEIRNRVPVHVGGSRELLAGIASS